ncbi:uncharacterized protein LOC106672472 [Cimex lectularius]|uniref:Uncharacterized protein n=1 Tax=Cimex lectularius TaxID=79782 RepID=A0A8I6TH69_CIMLE|nr:uncharacterized protein LOC106672472 [Cimex lectularius]
MEDYDFDELNFLLRVHIHAGENGEIYVSNITEAHDLTSEQGAGDMTAHRRIVSSSVFGSRRIWKKIRRFLIVVTASMIVPALILTSSFMVDDGFFLGAKFKDKDTSMVRIKYHMNHCLGSIHNYVQNMRNMKEEFNELEHSKDMDITYSRPMNEFLDELSLFYNKLVLDIVDLKEFTDNLQTRPIENL